jgi:GntP family gluconate:H+ symporter
MPWAMAGIAALIGLPLFFEVGVVLLVPVVVLVARRLRLPIVAVGIPALAGLSVLHGLVPPHPGPLVAIDALGANLGLTLLFGLATAIPTVLVAGPLFAKLAVRWVPVAAPDVAPDGKADVPAEAPEEQRRGRVGVGAAVVVVLVPVHGDRPARPAGRDGPARALPVDRRLAAADRGDPADRRRRWRLQADPDRRRGG